MFRTFSVNSGLKHGDDLSSLLFSFVSGNTIKKVQLIQPILMYMVLILGGVMVSVLGIGPKVRGFNKPGQGRWICKGDKNPHHAFLWRGSKAVGTMP
jgi:hypothetical protein